MKSEIHTIDPFSPRSRAPSKCDLSFCWSLKSFQPCLIPRVGAHPRPWKNVSLPTAGVSGTAQHGTAWRQKKKEGAREGEKDAKNGARLQRPADRKPRAAWRVFFTYDRHSRGALIVASCIPKISCSFFFLYGPVKRQIDIFARPANSRA